MIFRFVFRRRGFGGLSHSDGLRLKRRFWKVHQFAAPKNKKGVGVGGMRIYKQATPNGVLPPERRAVEAMLNRPSFAGERHE